MVKTIYIARHGYRSNWLPEPHPPNPTGIDSDPALAPHGVEQAEQLAAFVHLLPINEQPQLILSSPFYRCVETARPLAKLLDIPVYLERGVGEKYGKGRKVIPEPANYEFLRQFFGNVLGEEKEWPRDEKLNVIPSLEGELDQEVFERAQLFWSRLVPVLDSQYPQVDNILIMTHAATKIALGMALLDRKGVLDYVDDESHALLRAGACSLDKYVRLGSQKWEILMNGNCEFLTNGEEMNWDFHSNVEAGSDEDIKQRLLHRKTHGEKEKTPVTETAVGVEEDEESVQEFEEFYVSVELPVRHSIDNKEFRVLKPSSQFQISDINDDHPMIKVSNSDTKTDLGKTRDVQTSVEGRIFQTEWRLLVGLELIFDDYGELVGKVRDHLVTQEYVAVAPVKRADGGDGDDKPEGTFLKKAKALARQKQKESKKSQSQSVEVEAGK